MKFWSFFLFFNSITFILFAQYPDQVITIDCNPNGKTEYSANLNKGSLINDLYWASNSSVACFPATQNLKFNGNHVLHAFDLPPYANVSITVTPKDPTKNMSLYAYQQGKTSYYIPPTLSRCVSCEADHKWDYPKRGKTQDHSRTVSLNSIRNPYNVVVGVVGANGLKECDYTLTIQMESKDMSPKNQSPLKVFKAPSKKGSSLQYTASLDEGVKVHDLSWASNSSVACFPATQNQKFNGNHVHFLTEIPSRSKMTITVIPKTKTANLSLYAYQVGLNNTAMVPNLSACVSCEADHKWDYPKRGKTQDHTRSVSLMSVNNPYRVVIGVVGADGLTTGDFDLIIQVE